MRVLRMSGPHGGATRMDTRRVMRTSYLRAVGEALLGVERALRAGEALNDDAGIGVDEDRH